jgi:hypothetical protein
MTYFDLRYIFAVCPVANAIWESHRIFTSEECPMPDRHIAATLVQDIHLSAKNAIVHCPHHNYETDTVSL